MAERRTDRGDEQYRGLVPATLIQLREQPLPGIGQRFEIDLAAGRRLVVVAARDGGRSIAIIDPGSGDTDAARRLLQLSFDEAVMVGALLLGARFSISMPDGDHDEPGTVAVETIRVPDGAPSIGRAVREVLGDIADDVAVLGVVRDHTPEIVETDNEIPLAAGDRVVVASRPDRMTMVLDLLAQLP